MMNSFFNSILEEKVRVLSVRTSIHILSSYTNSTRFLISFSYHYFLPLLIQVELNCSMGVSQTWLNSLKLCMMIEEKNKVHNSGNKKHICE